MNYSAIFPDAVALRKKPHPRLRPFISHYVFRSIRFPRDHYIRKAMPLRIYSSIDFFIGDSFETFDCRTGQPVPFERCTIRGPRTRKLYYIRLSGHFVSFTIKFKLTGLYSLTGIPMPQFTNRSIPGHDPQPLPLQSMTRELLQAQGPEDCIKAVEPYLLLLAGKSRFNVLPAEMIKQRLTSRDIPLSMAQLALESHLSLRQLERAFLKEIGVSPKTLYRMIRFEKLIRSKISVPSAKWSAMAWEFGYDDQMHLARDFRQFLGINPSDFVPDDFAF